MFEVLLRELATRFGLGDKARELLGALLALVFDPPGGGFLGFVQRLRAAGLGTVTDSWLGRGENQPVAATALETALGTPLIELLAAKVGFTRERMAATLTALVPSVLDKLTPDGVQPLPGIVPPAVAPLIAGQEAFLAAARPLLPSLAAAPSRPVPTPLPAPLPAAAGADDHQHDDHSSQHEHASAASRDGGMGGRWIAWAALALIAAAAWAWFGSIGQSSTPVTVPGVPVAAPITWVQPRSYTEPTVEVGFREGQLRLAGALGSVAERERLLEAARQVPNTPLLEQLQVDTKLGPATWLDELASALPELRVEGLALTLAGELLDPTSFGAAAPADLPQRLRSRFARLRTVGSYEPSVQALDALTRSAAAGAAPTPAALADALNQLPLQFRDGSRQLQPASRRLLGRGAQALAHAPDGTLVEVGGHAERQGSAADNLELSEARAYAVVEALVADGVPFQRLTARGYGDGWPSSMDPAAIDRDRTIVFSVLR